MSIPKRKLTLNQDDTKISISDLVEFIHRRKQADYQRAPALISLEEVEKRHIQFVLSQADSIEAAAAILGITTVTLWRKRKQYSLA